MADGLYKATISMPFVSGLSEDVSQNALYFDSTGAGSNAADADTLKTYLVAWLNTVHTGAVKSYAQFIGTQVSRAANACKIQFYFAAGAVPPPADWGSPVETRSFTLSAADVGTPLPAEVALALSYHADLTDIPESAANPTPPPATIRPASRFRGRIFIGPLMVAAGAASGATGDLVPSSAAKNTWAAGGDWLLDNVPADFEWRGISMKNGNSWPIIGGYVDDAFDTQRRRGSAPTSRLTFGA